MRLNRIRYLVIFLLISIAVESYASLGSLTLEEMVQRSELIFIGTVLETRDYYKPGLIENKLKGLTSAEIENYLRINGFECRHRQLTKIAIENSIMNANEIKSITLDTCKVSMMDDSVFNKGETVLLFVEKKDRKYGTVNGFNGKLLIKNDMIKTYRKISDYTARNKVTKENGKSCYEPVLFNLSDFVNDISRTIKEEKY